MKWAHLGAICFPKRKSASQRATEVQTKPWGPCWAFLAELTFFLCWTCLCCVFFWIPKFIKFIKFIKFPNSQTLKDWQQEAKARWKPRESQGVSTMFCLGVWRSIFWYSPVRIWRKGVQTSPTKISKTQLRWCSRTSIGKSWHWHRPQNICCICCICCCDLIIMISLLITFLIMPISADLRIPCPIWPEMARLRRMIRYDKIFFQRTPSESIWIWCEFDVNM